MLTCAIKNKHLELRWEAGCRVHRLEEPERLALRGLPAMGLTDCSAHLAPAAAAGQSWILDCLFSSVFFSCLVRLKPSRQNLGTASQSFVVQAAHAVAIAVVRAAVLQCSCHWVCSLNVPANSQVEILVLLFGIIFFQRNIFYACKLWTVTRLEGKQQVSCWDGTHTQTFSCCCHELQTEREICKGN